MFSCVWNDKTRQATAHTGTRTLVKIFSFNGISATKKQDTHYRKKERKKEKELWFGTFLFELLRVLLFVIYEIVRSLFCLLPSFTQHTHIHTTNTQTTRPVAIDRERRRSNIKSSTIIKHQTTTKPWVNKATRVSNAISVGPYYWRIKKGTLALTLVETKSWYGLIQTELWLTDPVANGSNDNGCVVMLT